MAGAVQGRSRLLIPLAKALPGGEGPGSLSASSQTGAVISTVRTGSASSAGGTHNSHPIFCPREQEGALRLPLPNDRHDVGRRNSRSSSPWVGGEAGSSGPQLRGADFPSPGSKALPSAVCFARAP